MGFSKLVFFTEKLFELALEAILLIFGILEDLDVFQFVIGNQLLIEPDISRVSLGYQDPHLFEILDSLAVLNVI